MIGLLVLSFIVGETNRASKINRPRILMEMRMCLFKDYTTPVYTFQLYEVDIICLYLVVCELSLTL